MFCSLQTTIIPTFSIFESYVAHTVCCIALVFSNWSPLHSYMYHSPTKSLYIHITLVYHSQMKCRNCVSWERYTLGWLIRIVSFSGLCLPRRQQNGEILLPRLVQDWKDRWRFTAFVMRLEVWVPVPGIMHREGSVKEGSACHSCLVRVFSWLYLKISDHSLPHRALKWWFEPLPSSL